MPDATCPARPDGQHCDHWYDDSAPCCECGTGQTAPETACLALLADGPLTAHDVAVSLARTLSTGYEQALAEMWALVQDGTVDYRADGTFRLTAPLPEETP